MRFRRHPAPQLAAVPSDEPVAGSVDLATLRELVESARSLGFEVFPAGAYAAMAERAERAEALLAAEAERQRSLPDHTPLMRKLGEIAGEFPRTAAELSEQRRENVRLELQNGRLERDLSTVARALIGDEFPETTID